MTPFQRIRRIRRYIDNPLPRSLFNCDNLSSTPHWRRDATRLCVRLDKRDKAYRSELSWLASYAEELTADRLSLLSCVAGFKATKAVSIERIHAQEVLWALVMSLGDEPDCNPKGAK